MLQDQFTPEDWLGALMGMKKYYPMFSDDRMKQCLPDLVSELSDRGKREKLDLVVPLLDQVTGKPSFGTLLYASYPQCVFPYSFCKQNALENEYVHPIYKYLSFFAEREWSKNILIDRRNI